MILYEQTEASNNWRCVDQSKACSVDYFIYSIFTSRCPAAGLSALGFVIPHFWLMRVRDEDARLISKHRRWCHFLWRRRHHYSMKMLISTLDKSLYLIGVFVMRIETRPKTTSISHHEYPWAVVLGRSQYESQVPMMPPYSN